jgi:hypothetical protein
MTEETILYRFVLRRDTADNWWNGDPEATLLKQGEIGLETDTGKAKIGDGNTPWRLLRYALPGEIDLTGLTAGSILEYDGSKWIVSNTNRKQRFIGATFDGGTDDITAGAACDVMVRYPCTIKGVDLLADTGGDIQIDILVDGMLAYPPLDADSICASALPELTGGARVRDDTLTGWTVDLPADRCVRFVVRSCSGIKRAFISLTVERTD